jgi:hypothetical protein
LLADLVGFAPQIGFIVQWDNPAGLQMIYAEKGESQAPRKEGREDGQKHRRS